MDTIHIEKLKEALHTERTRLTAELSSIAKPDPRMKGNWVANYPQMDPSETGSDGTSRDTEEDEVEQYEVNLEAEHSLESRLLAVTKALHRIDSGAYGTCAKCGNPIPADRLAANPAAEFDIEHQQ